LFYYVSITVLKKSVHLSCRLSVRRFSTNKQNWTELTRKPNHCCRQMLMPRLLMLSPSLPHDTRESLLCQR